MIKVNLLRVNLTYMVKSSLSRPSLDLKVPKYSEVEQLIRFYLAFNPIAGALKPKNLFEVSIRRNSFRIEKLSNRS